MRTHLAILLAAVFAALIGPSLPCQRQDHLYFWNQQGPSQLGNLAVVGARDPATGLPYIVDQQYVPTAPVGHTNGDKPTASFVDRDGFVWVLDNGGFVTKVVPPPVPVANRVLFRTALPGAADLAFDSQGDAWIAGDNGIVTRLDGTTGAITAQVSVTAFGTPRHLVVLANGEVYVACSSIARVRPVGSGWVAELCRGLFAYDLTATAVDELVVSRDSPSNVIEIAVLDPATGNDLRASSGSQAGDHPYIHLTPVPLADGSWLLLGTPSGGTCSEWTQIAATRLTDFSHPHTTFCLNGPYPFRPKSTTLDGSGRAYGYNEEGLIGYTDVTRTAVLANAALRFTWPAALQEKAALRGDPSGFVRAVTIDALRDDDGDGFANLDEVRNGGNPFDATTAPTSHPPRLTARPGVVPLGSGFRLDLAGEPLAAFAVFYGPPAAAPLPVPPLVGLLLVDPLQISLLLPLGGLFVIPGAGVFQITLGVPNNPALANVQLHFQGLAFGQDPARTGFSNLTTVLLQ